MLPLILGAMINSNVEVCQWAADGSITKLKEAVSLNSQLVHKKDQSDRTPLHWAASAGNEEAVRVLLSYGAAVIFYSHSRSHVSRLSPWPIFTVQISVCFSDRRHG